MSEIDLQKLREQEAQLREQLAMLEAERRRLEAEEERKKLEEKKLRELETPIHLTVTKMASGGLIVEGDFRSDLLEVYRSIPGRSYRGKDYQSGKGQNWIPLGEWAACEAKLLARPNVTLSWGPNVKEQVEWYLNAPPWEIDVHPNGKVFTAKAGPRCPNTHALQALPGAEFEWENKHWTVPVTEGWRIFEVLKEVEGVVYTDVARERIYEQVERRAKLDEIAKKQDTDLVIESFPEDFVLRPFQKVGIEFIETAGGRVLLADEMGLGKTIQALGYSERRRLSHEGERGWQTIIVCPAHLKSNWFREVKRLTGIEPIVCSGGSPEFFTLMKIVNERHPYVIINYDILASTTEEHKTEEQEDGTQKVHTEVLWQWVGVINGAEPDLIVVDESHYAKNPDAKRTRALLQLNAPHIIHMTGTPVLNRPGEIWPSLRQLAPQDFKSYEGFLRHYTWNGKMARNVNELREMLRPIFLRRTKKDVLTELPPINRIYQYHELSERARKVYEEILDGIWPILREFNPAGVDGGKVDIMSILAQLTRMKQTCAADKVERTADLATEISDSHENGGPGKVLIFSHFKGTALEIARHLGSEALCFVRRTPTDFVTAPPEERDEIIKQFREDPAKRYLVVTEGSSREGHNIECAQAVIFNDLFWTPAAHAQAEGRAYGRLSNLHSIDSHYIIAEGTIEEWIMELLAKKLQIIEEVVEGVEGSREDSTVAMELIQRMKEEMWRR